MAKICKCGATVFGEYCYRCSSRIMSEVGGDRRRKLRRGTDNEAAMKGELYAAYGKLELHPINVAGYMQLRCAACRIVFLTIHDYDDSIALPLSALTHKCKR